MMKRMTAISAAALMIYAASPLNAFAQTDRPTYRAHGHHWVNDFNGSDAGASSGYSGSDFYLDAPGYPYAPQGGNSGGANFPHSGT